MAKLFGFSIEDTEKKSTSIISPVPKNNEDGVDNFISSGFYGQYVDIEGAYRSEYDLIRRYREMALHPECDGAIEDIVNEAIVSDLNDSPVQIDLDNLNAGDSLKKKIREEFKEEFSKTILKKDIKENDTFDEDAKNNFLKGAKIAYETIITDFSDNDNKITNAKPLLNKDIFNQFDGALKERAKRGHFAEITFIGVNKAEIKEHKKIGNILNVTVDFIAEVITCIKDKDQKIVSGDPEKIKKIYDTWIFSRDTTSSNPNWQLVNILT